MTGLYPHQAGMGWMAAADLGTPAYQDNLNKESVTIAEVLKTAGYSTYMTGKWHLTNERNIDGLVKRAGPNSVDLIVILESFRVLQIILHPPYIATIKRMRLLKISTLQMQFLITSVQFIENHFAKKKNPMFMYVAFTAPHWPLHALQKDIEKYKDKYKIGWIN